MCQSWQSPLPCWGWLLVERTRWRGLWNEEGQVQMAWLASTVSTRCRGFCKEVPLQDQCVIRHNTHRLLGIYLVRCKKSKRVGGCYSCTKWGPINLSRAASERASDAERPETPDACRLHHCFCALERHQEIHHCKLGKKKEKTWQTRYD